VHVQELCEPTDADSVLVSTTKQEFLVAVQEFQKAHQDRRSATDATL
jgi:hypothetical protein